MTDRYGVIGNPVGHSLSPRIHALFAHQTAQDLRYEALTAPVDGFDSVVRKFMLEGGRGLNVTLPFKQSAFRFAQCCSPRAAAAAAVNTLSFGPGEIFGDNTDGVGLVRDLEVNLGFSIAGHSVLLLGAGGAARGVLLPLLERNPSRLLIANRNADRARQLATKIRTADGPVAEASGLDELAGQAFDLIINATSAGLGSEPLAVPVEVFSPQCFAYDMVYGRNTPFLSQARGAGARSTDGLGMLVEQAAESFALWRGVRPETIAILAQLRRT